MLNIVETKLQFLSVFVVGLQIDGFYVQFLQRSEINGEVGGIYISKIQLNVQLVAVLNVYMSEFMGLTWIKVNWLRNFMKLTGALVRSGKLSEASGRSWKL